MPLNVEIRSKYEALLSDIKSLRFLDLDSIAQKRDDLEKIEHEEYSNTPAPYTSLEARSLAQKKLIDRQDNFISKDEISNILPEYLKK